MQHAFVSGRQLGVACLCSRQGLTPSSGPEALADASSPPPLCTALRETAELVRGHARAHTESRILHRDARDAADGDAADGAAARPAARGPRAPPAFSECSRLQHVVARRRSTRERTPPTVGDEHAQFVSVIGEVIANVGALLPVEMLHALSSTRSSGLLTSHAVELTARSCHHCSAGGAAALKHVLRKNAQVAGRSRGRVEELGATRRRALRGLQRCRAPPCRGRCRARSPNNASLGRSAPGPRGTATGTRSAGEANGPLVDR